MALIPDGGNVLIGQNVEIQPEKIQPTYTYKVDFETGHIAGVVDGIEAMKQAIFKIILTERFTYLIYSWNYGIELNALFGRSWNVVSSEIKRVLKEALLADDRIEEVLNIVVTQIDKRTVLVTFTAATIFGVLPVEQEYKFAT